MKKHLAMICVPPEFDYDPLPNMGPKINHHFTLNNAKYVEVEHPRWGLIVGIFLIKNIKAGDEIFTHYGYSKMDFPNDHPWYHMAERKQNEL